MAAEHCQKDQALVTFYENTLRHIRAQKAKEGSAAQLYEELQL